MLNNVVTISRHMKISNYISLSFGIFWILSVKDWKQLFKFLPRKPENIQKLTNNIIVYDK